MRGYWIWRGCTAALLVLGVGACSETRLAMHLAKKANHYTDGSHTQPPTRTYQPSRNKPVKVGKPYQIKGQWYYPKNTPNYNETGIASWYGEPFHGRRTANGDVYDMYALTAAHKTLPMPSKVLVTNLENGRQLSVYVNDRGPFVHGRIIDLSYRAAQLLGFERQGIAKVRVTLLDNHVPPAPSERTVVAGGNTESLPAVPQVAVASESLEALPGTQQADITRTDLAPAGGPRVASAGARRSDFAVAAKQADSGIKVTHVAVGDAEIYVQAGAFMVFENAHRLRSRLSVFGNSRVHRARIGGREFFRVRIGPLATVSDADRILSSVIDSGHDHASIVVE